MNKLILLRHGQSQWNLENRFTGWKNVPLTEKGETEAKKAGELIKKHKINIDRVFSSVLERANRTAEIAIKQAELNNLLENNQLVMSRSEKLNERDYGDLVGLNKKETSEKFGNDQVHIWRRSYDTPPPNGESLKDVVERVAPYFEENIKPIINKGENILIAAHGNSLRAMMIQLGMYKPEEISSIEIPTGLPLCINLDKGRLVDFKYLN
ncbi:MAG: 2,3-bisphosphoglycerate-dependent phosphoglycerate mutase [Rickettsiales bacterium]|nr:2,3-bisphosphoglycerate-dependent phosphoglycerate mutase [Rickettsiales bacterium]|tara:strand:- start:29 stop:658 length:630 start_codon:yes stop_codon:yes gene_type:complete